MSCRTSASWGVLAVALTLIVAPNSWAGGHYRVLHNFKGGTDSNGPALFAALAMDGNGNLYGAGGGGSGANCDPKYGCSGVAFEIMRGVANTWTEKILYTFRGYYEDGQPVTSLALDLHGNLYGGARGGPQGTAIVYQLTPARAEWKFNLLPVWGTEIGLIADAEGKNFYGLWGDSVQELSYGSDGWELTMLSDFCPSGGDCKNGDRPLAPLSWDSKGNLYGTTYEGGPPYPGCYCGVAFQMTPNKDGSWSYHVLHRFGAFKNDGRYPYGSLTVDASGNSYGTTTGGGGSYNAGTVFKLAPTKSGLWKETLIFDFQSVSNKGYGSPGGNLVFDKTGNIYGTAGSFLCNGTCGIVFKLTPQAGGHWKFSLVHQFNGSDGDFPNGLTIDSQGHLYGTTSGGGKYNYGVVFEITP